MTTWKSRYLGWMGLLVGLSMLLAMAGGCDCGKPPLTENGNTEGITDATIDGGPDQTQPTCTVQCDCPQGQDCQSGVCVVPTIPVYCCDRDNCPQGFACTDSAGNAASCGQRKSCTNPCDCNQRNSCIDGVCTATNKPTFCCEKAGCQPGQACTSRLGGEKVCGGEGQPCVSVCDCQGGLACINGQCTKSGTPVYCCESTNCPAGAACENQRGAKGQCGVTQQCQNTCECPTGQACTNGKCEASPVPVYCCNDPSKCPTGQVCDTKDGQRQTCPAQTQCKNHCDCAQGLFCDNGQCAKGATPVYCCEKPGCPSATACYKADGSVDSCSSPACKSPDDCGKPSCAQQGTQCSQAVPVCDGGVCGSLVKSGPGVCDPSSGKCQSAPPECKTHCDCPQASECSNGQCQPPPPVPGAGTFCCSKPGCPEGRACFNTTGTPGTCPGTAACKSDSDCPAGTCRANGSDCIQFKNACDLRTGQCVQSNGALVANATCRITNGVGTCIPRTCSNNGDCGTPTCRALGSSDCLQSIPVCSNGTCTQQGAVVRGATCNTSNGACLPNSQPCKSTCECSQGLACLNNTCQKSPNGAVYCCDNPGCPAGATCVDRNNVGGTCTPPPQCKSDSDCKKTTCQQAGFVCISTSERCINNACQASTSTSMTGTCDPASGACVPLNACVTPCDCPQGETCQRGPTGSICVKGPTPVYCCSKSGCPSNQTCVESNGRPGTCPIVCQSPCDCAAGLDCVGTSCIAGTAPVYCCDNAQQCPAGAVCKSKAGVGGTCPTAPRPCKVACDCVQGEGCVNGQCAKTATPTYCCDSPGCQSGAACTNKLGQNGSCPVTCTTHCDCPQGHSCSQGVCSTNVTGAYCCSKPGCPSNFGCFNTNGSRGQCPVQSCTSACDCNQGEDCRNGSCLRVNPPVYCCSGAGCPSGQACKDKTNTWGTCAATPACKSPCDCPQGRDCHNGQCIQVFPAVYCCSNVGCPAGQACYDSNNAPSVCPGSQCTGACDCPNQGQACVRGRCVTTNPRIYCCSKPNCLAGNACENQNGTAGTCAGPSCKNACDCNQGEDCRNGSCIRVSPPVYCCSKAGCVSGQACINTDGSSSACAVQCKNRCDCQQGFICSNGTCFRSSNGYCCDNPGCPAGATCQSRSGQNSICGGTPPPTSCKTRCDCPQGQECQSGKCTQTPNRVYCCNNPGCPPGFSCRDKSDAPGFCSP